MLFHLIGNILGIEAILLTVPMITALIYRESAFPFLITMALLLAVALPLILIKPRDTKIYAKEGFVCVSLSWISLSLAGALPFVISGAIPSFVDALFETVSGFTTTGASILTEVESLPKGILLWRSFTHWIGGMGVLVFMLAILPQGDRAIHLMRAEVPGPTKGKIVPRLRKSAMILYGIYAALTATEVIALLCTGMPFYDSIVNSFATAGTGGFSVRNASIASYANPAAEWVIAIFMLIFGVNFNLYFFLLIKRFRDIFKNEELRVYLSLMLVSSALIAINIFDTVKNTGAAIRTAFFQVTTIMSTAGFSTADFNLWPSFSKTLIIFLMILGACAGSTAGGFKISRAIILVKNFFREIKHAIRPKSVNVMRIDREIVPEETIRAAGNYLSVYLVVFLSAFLLISLDGFDVETNFTTVLSCLNNVGPGMGATGPMSNYSCFSPMIKLLLTFVMLIGRLEIMPMIIFFSPRTWRK